MKIALRVVLIVFALLLLAGGGLVWFLQRASSDSVTQDDGVAAGYNQRIDYTAPLEQKFSKAGPYGFAEHTTPSGDPKIGDYHMYVPTQPNGTQPREKFPLVVMTNGTNTPVPLYKPVLEHLASWGFVVVGNDDKSSGSGESTRKTIDFALQQAATPGSGLSGFVAEEAVGVMGHSQGGAGAINAVTAHDRVTSLYTASAIKQSIAQSLHNPYDVGALKVPSFFMAGTRLEDQFIISPHDQLTSNFESFTSDEPVVIARRKDVDHKDVLEYGDPYMTAWFMWTLKNDTEAAQVFVGDQAEILTNPVWQDVERKNAQ